MWETHVSVATKHFVCCGYGRGEGLSAPIGVHVFSPL